MGIMGRMGPMPLMGQPSTMNVAITRFLKVQVRILKMSATIVAGMR